MPGERIRKYRYFFALFNNRMGDRRHGKRLASTRDNAGAGARQPLKRDENRTDCRKKRWSSGEFTGSGETILTSLSRPLRDGM
jgi:hypothetical protein